MSKLTIDYNYIEYSNYLIFEGKTLAFRKRELFCIDGVPTILKRSEQGWWIGRKLLTPTKAQELIIRDKKKVDVGGLQWYEQIKLREVFNL